MFSLNKQKCISFFRCESMWTAILIGVLALLFFLPIVSHYVFDSIPQSVMFIVMATLLAAFFFISLFVWSEQAYDEREEYQQLQMNKWAFIMGGMSIILLIMYQALSGGIDIALPIILLIMLITKLVLKNYYRLKDNGYIK